MANTERSEGGAGLGAHGCHEYFGAQTSRGARRYAKVSRGVRLVSIQRLEALLAQSASTGQLKREE